MENLGENVANHFDFNNTETDFEEILDFNNIFNPNQTEISLTLNQEKNTTKIIDSKENVNKNLKTISDVRKSYTNDFSDTQSNLKTENRERIYNGTKVVDLPKSNCTVSIPNYTVQQNTDSCLKEFNEILNNYKKEHIKLDVSTIDDDKTCGHKNLDSPSISTWQNIYEVFTLTNEFSGASASIGNDVLIDLSQVNDTLDTPQTFCKTENFNVYEVSNFIKNYELNKNHNNLAVSKGITSKDDEDSKNELEFAEFNPENVFPQEMKTEICSFKVTEDVKAVNLNTKTKLSNINNISAISISSDEDNIVLSELFTQSKKFKHDFDINSDETENVLDLSNDGYNSSDFEFIDEKEATKDCLFPPANVLNDDSILHDYFKSLYSRSDRNIVNGDAKDHSMPDGEGYVNLFRNCTPYPMYCFENKCTNSGARMDGFDEMLCEVDNFRDESTSEQRREAKETEGKILSMYPSENRRRRRY